MELSTLVIYHQGPGCRMDAEQDLISRYASNLCVCCPLFPYVAFHVSLCVRIRISMPFLHNISYKGKGHIYRKEE